MNKLILKPKGGSGEVDPSSILSQLLVYGNWLAWHSSWGGGRHWHCKAIESDGLPSEIEWTSFLTAHIYKEEPVLIDDPIEEDAQIFEPGYRQAPSAAVEFYWWDSTMMVIISAEPIVFSVRKTHELELCCGGFDSRDDGSAEQQLTSLQRHATWRLPWMRRG